MVSACGKQCSGNFCVFGSAIFEPPPSVGAAPSSASPSTVVSTPFLGVISHLRGRSSGEHESRASTSQEQAKHGSRQAGRAIYVSRGREAEARGREPNHDNISGEA